MCLAHCNCFKNVYYYGLYEHAEIKIHSKEKCSFFSKWKSVTVVLCVWAKATPTIPQLRWTAAAGDHAGGYHCPSQTLVVTFLLSFFFFIWVKYIVAVFSQPLCLSLPLDWRSFKAFSSRMASLKMSLRLCQHLELTRPNQNTTWLFRERRATWPRTP